MGLILGLCEIQGITFSAFEPLKCAAKKKSLKFVTF